MHAEYRSLLAARRDRPRGPGHRRHRVRAGASVPVPTRGRWRAMSSVAAYDAGLGDDVAMPGYGVRPEFDADFASQFGIPKPIIAAVNGPAAGVGLVLACYCDLRFAAQGAKLTTSHGRLGLPAEYGLSWLLPRLVGVTRAADLLLSSRVVLAEEAERLGSGQPGAAAGRAAGLHLRLRRAARHGDRAVLAGRDQAAALPRPARRRRLVGARRRRPHGRHDAGRRLRRRCGRPDREAPAGLPRPTGREPAPERLRRRRRREAWPGPSRAAPPPGGRRTGRSCRPRR